MWVRHGIFCALVKVASNMPAGNQAVAIGWLGQGRAAIHIYDSARRPIATGTSSDGIWFSPRLELDAETYVVAISIGSLEATQSIKVIPSSEFPKPPDEITSSDIPEQLRELVTNTLLLRRPVSGLPDF
jgi:hypothetical protein